MAKKSTSKKSDTLAGLTPEARGVLQAGREAWETEQNASAEHVSPLSAQTIRRFLEAKAKKITREQIAVGWGTTTGALSRHAKVAAHANDPFPSKSNPEYPSILAALDSGKVTLSAIYKVLSEADSGKATRGGKPKDSLAAAVAAVAGRKIKFKDGRKVRTLSIMESRADMLAAIAVLLATPTMGLKASTQQSIMDLIPTEPEVATATPDAADEDDSDSDDATERKAS